MTTATISRTEQDFFNRVIAAASNCKSLQETATNNPERFQWELAVELPYIMNRLLGDEARILCDDKAISLIIEAVWEDVNASA